MNEIPTPILEGIKEDLDCQVGQFMKMNDRLDWLLRLLEEDIGLGPCDARCRDEFQPALLSQLAGCKNEIGHELDVLERHLSRLEQIIKIPRKSDPLSPSS